MAGASSRFRSYREGRLTFIKEGIVNTRKRYGGPPLQYRGGRAGSMSPNGTASAGRKP